MEEPNRQVPPSSHALRIIIVHLWSLLFIVDLIFVPMAFVAYQFRAGNTWHRQDADAPSLAIAIFLTQSITLCIVAALCRFHPRAARLPDRGSTRSASSPEEHLDLLNLTLNLVPGISLFILGIVAMVEEAGTYPRDVDVGAAVGAIIVAILHFALSGTYTWRWFSARSQRVTPGPNPFYQVRERLWGIGAVPGPSSSPKHSEAGLVNESGEQETDHMLLSPTVSVD